MFLHDPSRIRHDSGRFARLAAHRPSSSLNSNSACQIIHDGNRATSFSRNAGGGLLNACRSVPPADFDRARAAGGRTVSSRRARRRRASAQFQRYSVRSSELDDRGTSRCYRCFSMPASRIGDQISTTQENAPRWSNSQSEVPPMTCFQIIAELVVDRDRGIAPSIQFP